MKWPYLVLDLPETTSNDDDVRRAYLREVRKYPPEKSPQIFTEVRHAYEMLETREKRANLRLFGLNPSPHSLAELVPDTEDSRETIPMQVWLGE